MGVAVGGGAFCFLIASNSTTRHFAIWRSRHALIMARGAEESCTSRPDGCSAGAERPQDEGLMRPDDACRTAAKRRRRKALAVTSTVAPVSASMAIHSELMPSRVVMRNTALRPSAMACQMFDKVGRSSAMSSATPTTRFCNRDFDHGAAPSRRLIVSRD